MIALFAAVIVGVAPDTTTAATWGSQLKRYPYVTDLVGGAATINWATERVSGTSPTGSVKYGVVTSGSCTPSTAVSATKVAISVNGIPEYQWKARLTLAPDTEYCYRVFMGPTDLLASDPSPRFWTQYSPNAGRYSFVVFGDWGETSATGNPDQANLMAQIARTGARFAVTTGDNAYPSGDQKNYGDLYQTGAGVSGVFGPNYWKVPGASMALFPALGNHGLSSVSGGTNTQLLNFPQDQAVATSGGTYTNQTYCCLDGTASATYPSAWYAFNAGNARFYVLDASWSEANAGTAPGGAYHVDRDYHWQPTSAEYQWLKADLENPATPQLRFAFFHYPPYSVNNTEATDSYLRPPTPSSLEELLGSHGVDFGFTGHAHLYERNLRHSGLVTYLTGGGGATSQNVDTGRFCPSWAAYAIGWSSSGGRACSQTGNAPAPTSRAQVVHFLLVTVTGSSVTITPTNSAGGTFDVQTYDTSSSNASAPTAPSQLTATATSPNRVSLEWAASTDDGPATAYDGLLEYDVYRAAAGGSSIRIGSTTATSFVDSAADASTAYSYSVRARDAWGNTSPPSNTATAVTPAPQVVTLSPTDDTSVLAAQPSTALDPNLTTIGVDNSPVKHMLLKFDLSTLQGVDVVSARLRLYDTNPSSRGGDFYATTSSNWDERTVTWDTAPASTGAPIGSLAAVSANTWYELDVKSAVNAGSALSLRVTSPSSDGADYVSSEGDAAFRPQLVVSFVGDTSSQPPPAPTGLRAAGGDARVTLNWDPSAGATTYDVYRGVVAGASSAGPPLATGVSKATYVDASVVNGVTYYYTVRAVNAAGSSGTSNEAAATPSPPSPPSAPGGLVATAASNRVDLTWTASDSATAYNVYRSLTPGAHTGSEAPFAAGVSGTTYADTTAVNGTTYYYVVTATNAGGESGNSNEVSATPAPRPPAAPADLRASAGDSRVTLAWNASPGAVSYNVYRSTISGGTRDRIATALTTTGFTDATAQNGTTYYYVVRAANSDGESGDSNEAAATPTSASAAAVFADGFESSTVGSPPSVPPWSTRAGLIVENTLVHSGTKAAQANTTNGATYAKKDLPSTYTAGYLRVYFNLLSQATGTAGQVNLLRYRTAGSTSAGGDASIVYLGIRDGRLYLYNVASQQVPQTTGTALVAPGSGWHALELHAVVAGAASTTEVWLDGIKVNELSTTTDLGNVPIGKVQIGEVQTSRTYNVAFDDVTFDTQRVGQAP